MKLGKPGDLANGLRQRSRHCKNDNHLFQLAVDGSGSPRQKFQLQEICDPKTKIQKSKSKTKNPQPQPKTQNPIPNQHPKSKMLNPKSYMPTGPEQPETPRRLKLRDRCRLRVAQAESLLLRHLIKSSRPLPAGGAPARKLAASTFNLYPPDH